MTSALRTINYERSLDQRMTFQEGDNSQHRIYHRRHDPPEAEVVPSRWTSDAPGEVGNRDGNEHAEACHELSDEESGSEYER
jgi:hypothetical protein